MGAAFKDTTYLWVLWHRGKNQSDVREVLGLYRHRADALDEGYRVSADGLTPVKDRVLASVLTLSRPDLCERSLRGLTAAG